MSTKGISKGPRLRHEVAPPPPPPPPKPTAVQAPQRVADVEGPDPTRKVDARTRLGGAKDTTGESFVKAKRPDSLTTKPVQSGMQERKTSFVEAATKQGVTGPQAERLWQMGPGANSLDPLTGFHTSMDKPRTLEKAMEHVGQGDGQRAFNVELDVHNLGGMNQALGGPKADQHLKAMSGMVNDELSKLGGQVTMFRGSGGKLGAVVTGDVTPERLDGALKQAQSNVDAYARRQHLQGVPHPSGKEPGTGLKARATEIHAKDSVERIQQDSSLDTTSTPAPTHTVPKSKPVKLADAARYGGKETPFQSSYDQQRSAFEKEAVKSGMSASAATRLWNEHAVNAQDRVTGLLDGNHRVPTVQNAIDLVKTDKSQHAVYVELDVANLGGLNQALGRQGADDVFRFTATTVQEELAKGVGGSATLVRHGGDEFSAVIVGPKATRENVTTALQNAQRKVDAYAHKNNLDGISHPKHPDSTSHNGTGLHFGVAQVTAKDSPRTLFDAADEAVLLGKSQGGR